MKVVLEKHDVIALLGKALGMTFTESNVSIDFETFEVTIYDASEILGTATETPTPKEIPPAPLPAPKQADDDPPLEDLLAKSKKLAQSRPAVGKDAKPRARARIPGEYDEPLPVDPLQGDD